MASLAIDFAQALPNNHTDASVNAAIDAGTFRNPSANVRPRFRYWVPDASVDDAVLAADVKGAGDVGAGGVEVLGYYLYGGTAQGEGNYTPTDWSVYGWGTPAWRTYELTSMRVFLLTSTTRTKVQSTSSSSCGQRSDHGFCNGTKSRPRSSCT